jgi:hypothetical protein
MGSNGGRAVAARRLRSRLAGWLRRFGERTTRAASALEQPPEPESALDHWMRVVASRAPQLLEGRGIRAGSPPALAEPRSGKRGPEPSEPVDHRVAAEPGSPPPVPKTELPQALPASGGGGAAVARPPGPGDGWSRRVVASASGTGREPAKLGPPPVPGERNPEPLPQPVHRPLWSRMRPRPVPEGAVNGVPAFVAAERTPVLAHRFSAPHNEPVAGAPWPVIEPARQLSPVPLAAPAPKPPHRAAQRWPSTERPAPDPVVWPSAAQPAGDRPDRWPALPDDRSLWTVPVGAFPAERVRRLDDEQRGV